MRMRQFILRPLGRTVAAAIMWHPFVFDISQVSLSAVDVPMTFEEGIETSFLSSLVNANRFTLTASGFAKVDGNERIVSHPDAEAGSFLEPAGVYGALPLDDLDAPTGASDPLNFTKTVAGDTIEYPGVHTLPDIFAGTGTGRGVVFTQSATGTGRFRAPNAKLTGVQAGDVVRMHALLRVETTAGGTIALRQNGQVAAINFTHDATGAITGTNASWASARVDFWPLPVLLGGEQFYYVWWDRVVTGTADIDFGVDFVNTVEGRKIHVCSLHWQRNPANAPAAVPITVPGAYGSDQITTGITSQVGFILHGVCSARSIAPSGIIAPPAIEIGLPYWPICTRVEVLNSTELADRGGPMPNINHPFYGRPWGSPTVLNRFFAPGWFPRGLITCTNPGENCGTINVTSVFQRRKDLRARIHGITTSSTRLTNLNIDTAVILPTGDTRDVYWQQTSVQNSTGSSTRLLANGDVAFTNGLFLGQTLWTSRAAYSVQADDTDAKRVYIGELCVETTSGGTVSIAGTRVHNSARCNIFSASRTTPINLITTGAAFTQFWMDAFYIGRGTVNSWAGDDMFGALTTAFQSLFFNQSERPVRVSEDGGETWADLDATSLTIPDLPHGNLGEHIGTYDFDTLAFTSAPDATKSLRVRYWFPSNSRPDVFGYQWTASQMDMGTHTRWPDNGDVFRIKKGNLWVDVTYQTGRYTTTTTYLRNTTGTPAVAAEAISNDFVQINRTDVVLDQTYTLDGAVWIGPKGGFFLTGNPQLNANGSVITGVTVQNNIGVHNGTNGFRFDWSLQAGSTCTLANAVFVEARSDRTLADGQGRTLTIGGAGPNNTLTFDNVTVISSANVGGLANAEAGATYVNASEVTTILAGRRSNYDDFAAPDAKVSQYLPAEFYDTVQGRALLPAPDRIFDFRFNAFAETDTGLPLNTVIETAVGNHPDWNPVIAALKAKFHQLPASTPTVYADTAVGATLATGLTGSGFDLYDHGNPEGYFALNSGTLTLARAMTGIDAVFPLITAAGQLIVVDKVLTDAPVVEIVPEITASSITGTPEDGQVLTANATVTGSPTPTLAYQWQASGTNISGQTASTITLDAAGMGLTNGETISCEITATNTAGSDTAEPTIAFVADVQAELIAAVNAGGGYSSVHDFTTATNPGTWTSEDLSANNRDFTAAAGTTQPGISGTLGATFDGADAVDQTIDGGTFTIVMSLVKDNASSDGTFISDQGQAVLVQYNDGSALTFSGSTVTVDGVSQADRNALHDTLDTNTNERLLKVAGLAMTGDTALRIGGRPTGGLMGSIRRIVVLEEGTMGAGLAAAVALAETWVVAA